MAERTFDYEEIAGIYKSMTEITGDEGNPDSIAGILHLADKELEDKCGVELQALYGPLADQLTLDWKNFSSNFPNFVNNFNNWTAVVSKASGDYTEFEERVQQHRADNPLGVASNGLSANYIDTSYYQTYADANIQQFQVDLANFDAAEMYDLTGAHYALSGASERLSKHKTQAIVEDAFLAAGAAICLYSAGSLIFGGGGAGTDLVPVNGGAGGAGTDLVVSGSGTGATVGGSTTNLLGEGYALSIDQGIAQATATGNTSALNAFQALKAKGCVNMVTDATGSVYQALDSSGHVLHTFYSTTSAASGAATASTASAASAASSGTSAARIWSAIRGAGTKMAAGWGNVEAGAAAAKDAVVGYASKHKVATGISVAGLAATGILSATND